VKTSASRFRRFSLPAAAVTFGRVFIVLAVIAMLAGLILPAFPNEGPWRARTDIRLSDLFKEAEEL